MKKYLPGGNVIHVGGTAILPGIVPKEEDQIQDDIITVKEDIKVVLEVIIITIEDDIDQDLLVDEVQEEALGDIGKEVIVEEVEVEIEVEVGVNLVFIENQEVKKVEINLMIVMVVEIMIINLGVKKVQVIIMIMIMNIIIIVIIIHILKMIKIIIMKKIII